jgi:hypothetical protein
MPGVGQYRSKLYLDPTGTVFIRGQKLVGSTTTELGTNTPVAGLTHTANNFIWIRSQVTGINPTTINIKAWGNTDPEPASWQFTITDNEPALQTSGSVALLSRLPTASTASPVLFTFNDYSITDLNPTTTPLADANNDGLVNELDYSIWRNSYGLVTTQGVSDGDFNLDSKVDGLDYAIWRNSVTQ